MKKSLSILLSVCMMLTLFNGLGIFAVTAASYDTIPLNGFTTWTQTELDKSSGNNGYANGCCTKLTVIKDAAYIVGDGNQAIKAVYGNSGSAYNNCIVNWTYGTGGPCTAGNVWAPMSGTVNYADYEGVRIAVLNANGQPANFTKITLRVTNGANYSSKMRYWEGAPVRDADGYFYFDFASFKTNGAAPGTDIYDYLKNYASGISMLCYGSSAENTCYYSAVELYRASNGSNVSKGDLTAAVNKLAALDATAYAEQIATAQSVLNNDTATQDEVDAQLAIINACIADYKAGLSDNYAYVQMDGIQKWTSAEASSMNGFGATYSISNEGLVGDATQSLKMTATGANSRFCFATQKNGGTFSAINPFQITNAEDGKLSDYDGIAIAFSDKNGNEIPITQFTARLMRDSADWGEYWKYEANYTNIDTCYVNGYYHLKFSDYTALTGIIDDLKVMSILFYKSVSAGETAYISDMKAFKVKEDVRYHKLSDAINTLKNYNQNGVYDDAIAAAETVLNNKAATQEEVDAATTAVNAILRDLLLAPVEFDEDNIVMSFGAISDIHIDGDANSYNCNKYTNALQLLKKYAGGNLDAVTIAGDISASEYDSSIGNAFKTITDGQLGEDANVFFVTGNHDAQGDQWSTLSQIYTDLAKYTEKDLPSSQHDRGNRHAIIGGYHYIAVNMMDYWNASEAMFVEQDLKWLDVQLAAARADKPGQPIFVYVHAGVYGTTYGSDLYTGKHWGSKLIYSHLENYPEVVTFSGHVHFPLADERTIYQKDFTSLNCGSVQYMAIEGGYLQTGGNTTVAESHDVSSGLLVQVDKNNNLKITRLDFANDAVIKEPFYVSAPDLEDKSHLYHYNDGYFTVGNTAPTFAENAQASGKLSGENMLVTFDAATDNDMVHHYVIDIQGLPSESLKSTKAYSEFYLYPQPEDFPDDYTFVVPYTLAAGDDSFKISVYAVDSMGLKSAPVVYKSKAGDIPGDIEVPTTGNLFVNGDFELATNSGWTAYQGSKVKAEASKNGSFGMHATGSGGWGTMVAQTVGVEAGENYVLSFWYKTNSVGANVQVKENDNNGTMIAGTGGWYSANEWTYVEYKFVAPSDKLFFNICGGGNGNAESVYFDDITLMKLGVKAPDLFDGGETSRTEETNTGLGLAFKFNVAANNITVQNGNVADLSNATVTIDGEDCMLVEFGAVVSNDISIGTDLDAFTLDNLSARTIKISAKYLIDLEEDSATFAVRIINIPVEQANATIFARPYCIYENTEGEQIVIYDDVANDTYNADLG